MKNAQNRFSALLAPANNIGVMNAGRTIQGFGGGMLYALAYTVIRMVYPAHIWSIAGGGTGPLWIGTVNGLCRWESPGPADCQSPRAGLPAGPVTGLIVASDRRHWVGIEGGGVYRLDADGGSAQALPAGLENRLIQDLARDDAGNVYAASFGGGVYRFDDDRWTALAGVAEEADGLVRSLFAGASLWVGSYGAGVAGVGPDGAVEILDASRGLGNGYVHTLLVDTDGSLWVGSNGGLTQFRLTPFRALTESSASAVPA